MDEHLVPLGGDWALRRDFAVRSAGVPVAGLDAYGADNERARLRDATPDRALLAWHSETVFQGT